MGNKETINYLAMMIDSLDKKERLLLSLVNKTELQGNCLNGLDYEGVNWAQFEILMIEKEAIIGTIEELDDGFDKLYSRVKKELDANKENYVSEIGTMKACIEKLTEIGVKISTSEEKNRREIERIMTAAKVGIGKARKNIKASSGYITSMYRAGAGLESTNIDSKK